MRLVRPCSWLARKAKKGWEGGGGDDGTSLVARCGVRTAYPWCRRRSYAWRSFSGSFSGPAREGGWDEGGGLGCRRLVKDEHLLALLGDGDTRLEEVEGLGAPQGEKIDLDARLVIEPVGWSVGERVALDEAKAGEILDFGKGG